MYLVFFLFFITEGVSRAKPVFEMSKFDEVVKKTLALEKHRKGNKVIFFFILSEFSSMGDHQPSLIHIF